VLDGDPAPSPQKGTGASQLSYGNCGERAEWIKMKLGMEVGLGPGHIVFDGDPAPLTQRDTAPQFSAQVFCGQKAGWIKMLYLVGR